jgi:hypothetical protein
MERVVATLLGELDSGMGGGDNTENSSHGNSPAPNRADLLDPSLFCPNIG